MNTTTIKILQHNVAAWRKEKRDLFRKYYEKENPDIILLNSTGNLENDVLFINKNYKSEKKNYKKEAKAGVGIAVRKDWRSKCQFLNDFDDDIIGVQIKMRGVEVVKIQR